MRKVIWCGTALVVCGAVTVLLAARYAADNPDSFLGRCAVVAGEMATRCNPLTAFQGMNRGEEIALVEVKPLAGDGPVIPGPEVPGQERPDEMGELPDAVEPIVVDAAPQPEELARQTNEPDTLRADEESEVDLPMPIVKPEEDVLDNPAFMPYADEDEHDGGQAANQDCAFLAQFFGWLLCGDEHCANAEDCPCKEISRAIAEVIHDLTGEEAEYEIIDELAEPVPAATDKDGDMSDSQENEEPASADPASAHFREDSSYHHQYPGCPYTGHCPYPYHYNVPPVQNPAPPQEKPVSKPESMTAKPIGKKESFIKNGLELVVHPDVDTMECRPTDLPEGEDSGPY
jgi:hypothetical protein